MSEQMPYGEMVQELAYLRGQYEQFIIDRERERIIDLIEKTHKHGMTHSERCAIRHDFADYLIERIKRGNE